jgi:hypothetical protein
LPRDEFLKRISTSIEETTLRLVEESREEQARLFRRAGNSASASA